MVVPEISADIDICAALNGAVKKRSAAAAANGGFFDAPARVHHLDRRQPGARLDARRQRRQRRKLRRAFRQRRTAVRPRQQFQLPESDGGQICFVDAAGRNVQIRMRGDERDVMADRLIDRVAVRQRPDRVINRRMMRENTVGADGNGFLDDIQCHIQRQQDAVQRF